MRFKGIAILAVACVALGVLSYDASADGRNPASCLLYPYFNTNPGNLAVITVTNTCPDTVHLRIVFISEDNDCMPKDYWRTLTGYDTFTFIDSGLNQKPMTGFLYIYVVEAYGSKAEKEADCLIGQEFVFGQWFPLQPLVNMGINAVSFEVVQGVNGDGKLQLDGVEYDQAPSAVMFPRYFGQIPPLFQSFLILINLTGGKYYEANIGFRIWDDSEHEFSDQIQIPCFWFGPLLTAVPDVTEGHLQLTSTDLDELYDGNPPPPVGPPHKKTGWMWVYGINSHYFINNFDNPGIYGVLVEQIGAGFGGDLPWEVFGTVNNAMLWSTSPNGL